MSHFGFLKVAIVFVLLNNTTSVAPIPSIFAMRGDSSLVDRSKDALPSSSQDVITENAPSNVISFGLTGNLNTGRASHTATLLPNGKVLVAGGSTTSYVPLASAEVYDPSASTWTAVASLNTGRTAHTATLLPNGKVMVAGGLTTSYVSLASVEVYDPSANTWTTVASLHTGRAGHTATMLQGGKVLVVGGHNSDWTTFASAEIYDPASNTWSTAGSLTTSRSNHTATLLQSGKVLVVGGVNGIGTPIASAEIYDPASNTWSPAGSLTTARGDHTATLLQNGKLLVVGGYNGSGTPSQSFASAEIYDPASSIWSPAGSLITARSWHMATLLPNGNMLAVGGYTTSNSTIVANGEVYDPATNIWSPAGSLTVARRYSTLTLLPNGKVLVVGGMGNSGVLSSVEIGTVDNAPPSLSIAHLEVTQVIQDEDNSVPLIAGKPTFVRVYVDCGIGCTSLPNVTGTLRGYGQSGELPGSPLLLGVQGSVTAYHENWLSQQGNLAKTLNFTLPTGWSSGTVKLEATVRASTSQATSASIDVAFENAKPIDVAYVPIRVSDQEPDSGRIRDAFRLASQLYPTAQFNYDPKPTWEWNPPTICSLRRDTNCLVKDLLNQLTRQFSGNAFVFGWLPSAKEICDYLHENCWLGAADAKYSNGVGQAAFGTDNPVVNGQEVSGQLILVHELAHLLGRHHTQTTSDPHQDCANLDTDSDWPNYAQTAKIREWGLNGYGFGWLLSSSSALKNPSETYDYMSYCWAKYNLPAWTSAWTYEHIFSESLKTQITNLTPQVLSAAQRYFIASGLVFTDDIVALDPIWVITTTTPGNNPPIGTSYCLEGQNVSGTSLVNRCFDLAFKSHDSAQVTDVDGFSLMIPYPNGVSRIVLKKGLQELAVREVSANAPVVTVLSPNGGEMWGATGVYTITWTATDGDSDPLTYNVLYSPDETNWVSVGTGITNTQLAVNAAELGGGSGARVRVLASDGINTSADESDAPFTVERKGPQAFILSPEGSGAIAPDTPLLLQGYAYDLEDGSLGESALHWSSNRDGDLGAGSQILTTLSPGQHIITLSAIDSDGTSATASVNIFAGSRVYLPLVKRNQ